MERSVIITCAVTGEGPINPRHPAFPVSPQQIADSALEAADAGAAIVHLHVRDPDTGHGSRSPELFGEVVERIKRSNRDVIINLSAGMGGDFCPDENDESRPAAGTDVISAEERLRHVAMLRPEICSLDVTTMNVENANAASVNSPATVYLNTTRTLRSMAARIRKLGVKPEIEVFGPGDLWFATQLIDEGLFEAPPLMQIVLGVKWGAPATIESACYLQRMLPAGVNWTVMGTSRAQMPIAAMSVMLGGHVRVGLEDNLYLHRGRFATNGELVEQAAALVRTLGGRVATSHEARGLLGL